MAMKRVYLTYVCDDKVGEVEGAFAEDGELLGCWSNNDACWRDEYFSPFMEKLGVETIWVDEFNDEKRFKQFVKKLRRAFK